jgi:hypothetical protein
MLEIFVRGTLIYLVLVIVGWSVAIDADARAGPASAGD